MASRQDTCFGAPSRDLDPPGRCADLARLFVTHSDAYLIQTRLEFGLVITTDLAVGDQLHQFRLDHATASPVETQPEKILSFKIRHLVRDG